MKDSVDGVAKCGVNFIFPIDDKERLKRYLDDGAIPQPIGITAQCLFKEIDIKFVERLHCENPGCSIRTDLPVVFVYKDGKIDAGGGLVLPSENVGGGLSSTTIHYEVSCQKGTHRCLDADCPR
jgi:hypothetical protein